jgi:hypothetical protein
MPSSKAAMRLRQHDGGRESDVVWFLAQVSSKTSFRTARSSDAWRSSASSNNDDAIVRLVGALLIKQNDDWTAQRARYMTHETISQMSDDPLISLPVVAR